MSDFAPGVAGGASIALLIVLFGALFRVIQLNLRTQRDCEKECASCRADLQWEQQRKDAMIHACQQANPPIVIPAIVWRRRDRLPHEEGEHGST